MQPRVHRAQVEEQLAENHCVHVLGLARQEAVDHGPKCSRASTAPKSKNSLRSTTACTFLGSRDKRPLAGPNTQQHVHCHQVEDLEEHHCTIGLVPPENVDRYCLIWLLPLPRWCGGGAA